MPNRETTAGRAHRATATPLKKPATRSAMPAKKNRVAPDPKPIVHARVHSPGQRDEPPAASIPSEQNGSAPHHPGLSVSATRLSGATPFPLAASRPTHLRAMPVNEIPPQRMRAYQLGFLSLFTKIIIAVVCALLIIQQAPLVIAGPAPESTLTISASNSTPGTSATLSSSQAPMSLATGTGIAMANSFYEPAGCLKPSDEYTRINIDGNMISQRTLEMLQQAGRLYRGPLDITSKGITKGGYLTPDRTIGTPPAPGDLSLGTHDGGGIVDLAVPDPTGTGFKEIEPLVRALRADGFAAWFRDETDGFYGNAHIHAVAIGDKDLSPEAKDQLTGIAGYFRGSNGLTGEFQQQDRHGGPILCQWMADAGYRDMRSATAIAQEITPANNWRATLRSAAESYITDNPDRAALLAQQLGWTGNGNESVSNMCGPLSAIQLDKAGLLPAQAWPPNYLKEAFWLASPTINGRPWIYFPQDQYSLTHVTTRIDKYDFESHPLCPGDFVYTFTNSYFGGDEHMLVVSDVDAKGRAWTVTNTMMINPITQKRQRNNLNQLLFSISKVMLYDPGNYDTGAFRKDWVTNFENYYTGLAGFDVLRRNGSCMAAGSLLTYAIRPGDTLPKIAAHFLTTIDAIAKQNGISDPRRLEAGAILDIPVNLTLMSNATGTGR
jgi:hypothetical protein